MAKAVRIGSGRSLPDSREVGMLVILVWMLLLIQAVLKLLWLPMVVTLCVFFYSRMSKRSPDGNLSRGRVVFGLLGFALLGGPIVASVSQHLYVAGLSYWANDLSINVPESELDSIDTTRIGTVAEDYRRIYSRDFQRHYLSSRFFVETWSSPKGLGVIEREQRLVDSRNNRVYASIRAFHLTGDHFYWSGLSRIHDVNGWGRINERVWSAYLDHVRHLYSYNCHGDDC